MDDAGLNAVISLGESFHSVDGNFMEPIEFLNRDPFTLGTLLNRPMKEGVGRWEKLGTVHGVEVSPGRSLKYGAVSTTASLKRLSLPAAGDVKDWGLSLAIWKRVVESKIGVWEIGGIGSVYGTVDYR